MKIERLLAEVAGLSPSARSARVVEVARALQGSDPQRLTQLLRELSTGDVYSRRLAVTMAAAAGRGDELARAVGDEQPAVSGPAVMAAGLPDAVVVDLATSGAAGLRRLVYRRLRRDGRADLAATCLPAVRARWGDREAASLLPACGRTTVRDVLPELAYAVASWYPLAVRYPDVVVEHATAELATRSAAATQRWWREETGLVAALARVRPQDVLDLAERYLAGGLPPALVRGLPELLRVDPPRVVRFLLAHPERARALAGLPLSRRTCARLARVDDADLAGLLRRSGGDPTLTCLLLRAVAPSRRAAVFDAARAGQAVATEVFPDELTSLLPWQRRHAEVRRMLALPQIAKDPLQVWWLTAYLPTEEAAPVLDRVTGSPDAEQRAVGYRLLIRNAALGRDPQQVGRLLGRLGQRVRNERDPVRQLVLRAVAELPYELITAAAVPGLDQLVTETLNARDASSASANAASRLALRVLWLSAGRADGEELARWALQTVERLGAWKIDAVLPGTDLPRLLRRGQEHQVWHALRAPAREALRRGEAWPVLRIARVLGRRAWGLAELQDLLADATTVKSDEVLRAAAGLWLADPATRAGRAGQLVAADPSTATIPAVLQTLITIRTDLLEQHVLTGRPLSGRLAPRGVWIPRITRRQQLRWTSRQHLRYRRMLRTGALDTGAGRWNQGWCVRALPASPGAVPADYVEFLTGDDVLIAEAVLAGLADADRPGRAARLLTEHLADDRARVATYALARCTRWIGPDQLTGLLTWLLYEAPKVVVRKEAARLIAAHHLLDAVGALLTGAQADGAHRDVRIAALTALVAFPDQPAIWPALGAAAAAPDEDVAGCLLGTRWTALPPPARSAYARLVTTVAGHPHGPTAASALGMLARWFPWADGAGRAVLHRALTDLDRLDVWRAAAATIADPTVWTTDEPLPADVAAALIDHLADGPDAGPDRDLPARRRLDHLLELFRRPPEDLRDHPGAALALAARLAERDQPARAALLHVLLAAPGPAARQHLPIAAELLAGRPVAAAEIASHLPPGNWDTPDTADLVAALLHGADPAAGLLALALTCAAGRATGWNSPWTGHLRGLRRHRDPDLRDAALAVETAAE